MPASLKDRTVLVIGRGSGVARAVALSIREAGGNVVVAGRNPLVYDDPGITAEQVDLTDEASIAALAERLGQADHVVSTASARTRGAVGDLGEVKKAELFAAREAGNPLHRIGRPEDIAEAVVFALTNTFMTGISLGVDGGEPLV